MTSQIINRHSVIARVPNVTIIKRKTVFEIIALCVFSYVALLLALVVFQRSAMYFPDRAVPELPPGASLVHIDTDDGLSIPAWYKAPTAEGAPVIIWFHGNAGNLSYFWAKAVQMTRNGAGVLMPEYRGYGGAPGKPTEANLVADAISAYNYLNGKGYAGSDVIVYGLSLGSGIAVQLAEYAAQEQGTPVNRVILEAPYSSTLDVARWRFPVFPVSLFMLDRYDSVSRITAIKAPLLIVHGVLDGVIPQRFGSKLFDAAAEPKQFMSIEQGGHNDLFAFPDVLPGMLAFMDEGISRKTAAEAAE